MLTAASLNALRTSALLCPPVVPGHLSPIHILIAGRWEYSRWIIRRADDTLFLLHQVFHEQHSRSAHIQRGQKRESLPPRRDGSKEPIHANDRSYHEIWGLVVKIKCPGKTRALNWYKEGWYYAWSGCHFRGFFRFIVLLNYILIECLFTPTCNPGVILTISFYFLVIVAYWKCQFQSHFLFSDC